MFRRAATLILSLLFFVLLPLGGCTGDADPVGITGTGEDVLAASQHAQGASAATTSMVRETGFLDLTLPAPCVGENVHLEGPVDIRIHTTIDGRGRPHQVAFYGWRDVVATGEDSGDTWHTSAAVEVYTLFNFEPAEPHQPAPPRTPLGAPGVFHHTGAIVLVSDGGGPNLHIRHLVQTVLDANGNVRVDTDIFELFECR